MWYLGDPKVKKVISYFFEFVNFLEYKLDLLELRSASSRASRLFSECLKNDFENYGCFCGYYYGYH